MEDSRTFTQEELNTIVQDRLAKEKAKYERQLADMQAEVGRREKRLDARERLREKGLPADLADLVRLDDDDAFNNSLELLERTYKNRQPDARSGGGSGATRHGYEPMGGSSVTADPIREAMGLR
nr:DUF4355 domain-containing protein [uncultured Acetatifactor sp.]